MKKMSMFALLLAAVLVTSYSVSGTYAKYTSEFTGKTDSARVAAWAFEIDDQAAANDFEFDLFNTVNDTKDSNKETDVADDETIIAPGTEGEFEIKLENLSEVNAKYAIDYTVTNEDDIPVEFSVDNGTTWTTELVDVAAIEDLTNDAQTVLNKDGGNKTIKVLWRWAFEGANSSNYKTSQTDETDTLLGTDGTSTITVQAKVVVTQID